jgi:nucleotide-binding universal stress UspA family protein
MVVMPTRSTSKAPRVVVGVDGSPSSRAALRWAVDHAALHGGTVDAVMARQVPETDVIGGFGQTPAELDDEKVIADDAQRSLDAIISEEVKADDRNRVRARVFLGHPATALVQASDGAELVAVGQRGLGSFTAALLGSVSEYLAHHANSPVLIFRGDARHLRA